MKLHKTYRQFGAFLAVIFGAVLPIAGCGTTINYTYDPIANFSTGRNYCLAPGSLTNHQECLIAKNAYNYANQSLNAKGFTLVAAGPDFVISMNYELEYPEAYSYGCGSSNLSVYGAQSKEPIWQGTAEGSIKADAASPDLSVAVMKILANFPPK